MINDLNPSQRELAEYMSSLSEEAYSARWMSGLELELWKAMKKEIVKYGRLEITDEIIAKLKDLSSKANGWIVFDDENEEIFLTWKLWNGYINDN